MEVFIVRIYRNDRKKDKRDPDSLVGIVEEIATKRKKAFRDFGELWKILNSAEIKRGNKLVI